MRGRTLLIAGLLTVAYAGQASAQIAGTEHDLSGPGDAYNNGEVCVYCHTPHAADTSVEAPLWNKPAVTSTYQSYSSTTMDGVRLDVGSVSIACLTCHDGTQAMDAVVNAPGMGAGNGFLGDGTNFMDSEEIAMLGTDLRNDHPIGIQYGGYEPNGTDPIDEDFWQDGADLTATTGLGKANLDGKDRWWVNTAAGGSIGRDKADMILYTRLNGTDQPFVECASCHDPHNDSEESVDSGNLDGDGQPIMISTSVNFLRMSNAGSAICLACHTK